MKPIRFLRSIIVKSPIKRLIALLRRSGFDIQILLPPASQHDTSRKYEFTRKGLQFKGDLAHHGNHHMYYDLPYFNFNILEPYFIDNSNILDIGANLGYFSALMNIKTKGNTFHLFEPFPSTFNELEEFVSRNDLKNFSLYNQCISNKKEVLYMSSINYNSGQNRVKSTKSDGIAVNANTVDNIVKSEKIKNISFIKIDVEGFELAVLQGAKETIELFKPFLFMELSSSNLKEQNVQPHQILEEIKKLGYKHILDINTEKEIQVASCDEIETDIFCIQE